ncbi:hypothetical protein GCM10020220_036130 [Nonomuraea rubra]
MATGAGGAGRGAVQADAASETVTRDKTVIRDKGGLRIRAKVVTAAERPQRVFHFVIRKAELPDRC